jgi:hypothetical protein
MSGQRELLPPWLAFPYIGWPSDGWRAGKAAFYLWQWSGWFRALSEIAQNDYKTRFPEPVGWTGFYKLSELRGARALLELSDCAISEFSESELAVETRVFYGGTGPQKKSAINDATHDPLQRLVVLILREAIALQCDGIEVSRGHEPTCSIIYLRGDQKIPREPFPVRLFDGFSLGLARLCGLEDGRGAGAFLVSEEEFGAFNVSVVFEDSCLRLTITETQDQTA